MDLAVQMLDDIIINFFWLQGYFLNSCLVLENVNRGQPVHWFHVPDRTESPTSIQIKPAWHEERRQVPI